MENTKPKKRPLLNGLKKLFGNPLVRGTLKTIPFGNLVYEWAENIKAAKDPEKQGQPLPHSPISLLAQTVFLGLIIYAFLTKQITIQDLLNYVGIDDFKSFGPAPGGGNVLDSLSN